MNVLSLPLGVKNITTKFNKPCKLKFATSLLTDVRSYDAVWGICVDSETKQIWIDYLKKGNQLSNTDLYTFSGDYCLVAVDDNEVLTITVDEFKKDGEV